MTPTSATVQQHQQHQQHQQQHQQHQHHQHPHAHPPQNQHQHLPPQHHRTSIDHQHYPPAYMHDPPYQLDIDRRHSYHPGQGAPGYTPGPIRPSTSKHQAHRGHPGHPGHPGQLPYHPEMVPFPGDGMRTPISRTTKACDSCRARKVRCNPDPSALIPGTCTRCSEANRECVFTSTQKKRGPAPGKTARSATSSSSAARANAGPDETYRERRETWSSSSAPQYSHREYPQMVPGPYSAPAHGGEAWPWAPGAQPPAGEPMPRGPPEAPLSAPPAHYYHPPPPYDPREQPTAYDSRERRAEARGHREPVPYDERGEPRTERHHPYPRPPRSAGQERRDSERRPSVGGWGEQHHHQRSGPSTPVYAPAPLSAPLHPAAHYPPQHGPAPPPPQAHGPQPPPGYPPHHAAPPFDPQYTMRPHPASGWPRRDHDHEHYRRGERSPSPRDRRRRD
ncbi:Glucose transport transcription regulator RGT1 [Vanrija pseudolonga]|uniref:Glucose transport transcription regulator RGT1 n=1 Tax=Vanrija pseudolonga TaxID=143232 RepID=A0AAF0Y2I1_9TREE|nr:Glucose transport transcription regulator RGT1 [Vanrija pseudolonga]